MLPDLPDLLRVLGRLAASALVLASASLAGASSAEADDTIPPTVTIDPAGGTFYAPDVSVTIDWCDDLQLDQGTRYIEFDGQDVTSSFSFSWENSEPGCSSHAQSVGSVTLTPDSAHTLYARICDHYQQPLGPLFPPGGGGGGACPSSNEGSRQASYTYDDKPPPVVSTAPQNGDIRSPGLCDACFDLNFTYSTPPYYTLGGPRSLTLFYSSQDAWPRGMVSLDVWNPAENPNPPDTVSLSLKKPNGTWVTFTTGTTEIFWDYPASNDTLRLTAQFNAQWFASKAFGYTAVVRSWRGTTVSETTVPVRVLIRNERYSDVAPGWTIAGVQKLIPEGDTLVVLLDGAGGITAFDEVATDVYQAPRGDFTEVRKTGTSTYTRLWPDSTKAFFSVQLDGVVKVDSVKDRFGNRTKYTYQADGRFARVTDPMDWYISVSYSATWGGIESISYFDAGAHNLGQVASMSGDAGTGDLLSITDRDGVSQSFTYSSIHRMITYTDRGGATTNYHYTLGRLWEIIGPQITDYNDWTGRPHTKFGSPEQIVLPPSNAGNIDSAAPPITPSEALAWVRGPLMDTTWLWFNGLGETTKTVDPLDDVTTSNYNADGLPTGVTEPGGQLTTYTWDGPRMTSKDVFGLRQTTYTYESTYGLPKQASIEGTVASTNYYDSQGALDSVRIGSLSDVVRHYSDSRGRETQVVDMMGNETHFSYDATTGNRERVIGAANDTTTRRFDAYGRDSLVISPTGDTTRILYDDLNRPTTVYDPLNPNPTRAYYGVIYPDSVVDPKGERRSFVHNAAGWLLEEYGPASATVGDSYGYDKEGRLRKWTNRNGQTLNYTLDVLGRPTSVTGPGIDLSYGYHTSSSDRYEWGSNAWSTDTIWYTPFGAVDSTKTVRGGTSYVVDYEHDHWSGRPTAIRDRYNARTFSFGYNDFAQLDSLVAWNTTYTVTDRDGDLVTTERTYPTFKQRFQCTADHRRATTFWGDTAAGDTLLLRGLGFDPSGRVDLVDPQPSDTARKYAYDELGRLERAETYQQSVPCTWIIFSGWSCGDTTLTLLSADTFTYDGLGNRTDGASGTVIDPGSRWRSNGLTSYEYDAVGNVVQRTLYVNPNTPYLGQDLFWNALGQLDSVVSTGGEHTRFHYDAFGRRIQVTDGSSTVKYVWAGGHVLFDIDDGTVTEYAYWPGVDRLHSMKRSGNVYYFLTDHLGSVLGVTDWLGAVKNTYDYGEWGTSRSASETVSNRMRYAGRELDPTGLYYLRARYYDARTGRFLSEDPLGVAAGLNPYSYADDSPLTFADPWGLQGDRTTDVPDRGVCYFDTGAGCFLGAIPGVTGYGHRDEFAVTPGQFWAGNRGGGQGAGFLWVSGGGGAGANTEQQAHTVEYQRLQSCPGDPITAAVLGDQGAAEFGLSVNDRAERGGSARVAMVASALMPWLWNTIRNAGPSGGRIPIDDRALAYWHTHPGLYPGSLQPPSDADTALAATYGRSLYTISRDSLFISYPNPGGRVRTVGCSR